MLAAIIIDISRTASSGRARIAHVHVIIAALGCPWLWYNTGTAINYNVSPIELSTNVPVRLNYLTAVNSVYLPSRDNGLAERFRAYRADCLPSNL